ncbi:MAG: hypothetical protein N2V74_00470 [Candidatus Methanospirare jalkutatii]|nr:MAG: hypothetical protein N2V74_05385 [Candidatus Methanospirare jalkutatii]UYZ40210.1 MAG: hypothetical protein N2V74_00470 [Candidatus Methanospirare jalkutatii]
MAEEEGGFFAIENDDVATQAQIKKIYALLHRLGKDPQKFKEERGFTNYAKLTKRQASELIDELEREEFRKIEEEVRAKAEQTSVAETQQEPSQPIQQIQQIQQAQQAQQTTSAGESVAQEAVELRREALVKEAEEVARAARLMRRCVSEAKRIVEEEMPFVVSEAIKAKTIGSIAATLFIQLESRSYRWEE